ncbi:MAG TPA: LytTR family DNA-binding domain-containing protein [Anaeromyxobacteraceae bacterium]|nr:LytTR family DNA-binding domain-containing protein [Anaeromyxobacteraceae bacterium]
MSEGNLLKALVLEDEWPTRNYLVKLIEGTNRAQVIGAVATVDEAREALAGSSVDVVFVDIQLAATGDSRTGLDLVRSMAGERGAPMFVLATASSQHSLEAFDLGVVDYLLKPYTEERVEQCLRRLLERRTPRPLAPRRVVARRKKSLVFLDPETIWAFEAADRLTYVHSPEGRFDIDLSLAAIEASFGRALFRVHRNWLVNLAYAKELERDGGDVTVVVGSDLGPEGRRIRAPVSQDHAKALRAALLENATGLRRT